MSNLTDAKKISCALVVLTGLIAALFFTCEKMPEYCGDGNPLDPARQFCFGGVTYDKCAGADYDPASQICENGVLKERCPGGNNFFNPVTEFCFGNGVYQLCGGNRFAPNNQVCRSNIVLNICADGREVPSGTPCDGYILTTTAAPGIGGSIARSPDAANYTPGTLVGVTATPANGYTFVGWSGASTSTNRTVSITMDGDKSLVAMFNEVSAPGTHTLTTTAIPEHGGSITRNPNAASYTAGTQVTVTAAAEPGYRFTGWGGASASTSIGIVVSMDGPRALIANFEPVRYTLTINISPAAGGTVTPASGLSHNMNTPVAITAAPASGYRFVNWSVTGGGTIADADSAAAAVTLTANAAITANFELIAHIHDWGDWIVTAPTCTDKGDSTRVCKINSTHTERREIEALGHDWGDWIVKAPTCTEKGDSTRVCKRNGAHTETKEIEALGHDWGDWELTTPATCTDKGDSTRVCKRNGAHTETKEIAALGHDWGTWSVTTPASCTAPGEETRICSRNSEHSDKRPIAQLVDILNGCHFNPAITYGSLTDMRDNQTYRTVVIGDQIWMAENLNFSGSGGNVGVCYGNNPNNCALYGRLYTWAEAMGLPPSCNSSLCAGEVDASKDICPEGWRVPTGADWTALTTAVGNPSATKLKSQTGWDSGRNGTNEFGFSALPGGGGYPDGSFFVVGSNGDWWCATEHGVYWASCLGMDGNTDVLMYSIYKGRSISLRCRQDVLP